MLKQLYRVCEKTGPLLCVQSNCERWSPFCCSIALLYLNPHWEASAFDLQAFVMLSDFHNSRTFTLNQENLTQQYSYLHSLTYHTSHSASQLDVYNQIYIIRSIQCGWVSENIGCYVRCWGGDYKQFFSVTILMYIMLLASVDIGYLIVFTYFKIRSSTSTNLKKQQQIMDVIPNI